MRGRFGLSPSHFPDDPAGFIKIGEQVLVETLVAQVLVKTFDEAILHRLAGRNVVPFDVVFVLPGQDSIGSELGAVVADDHSRATPEFDDAIELAHDPQAG